VIGRRSAVVALASASAWPARAQRRGVIYRIGIVGLNPTSDIEGPNPRTPQVAMLLRTLREMGYVYGQHYVTLAHGVSGNPLGMDGLIAALLRQKPDVIVATGAACAPLKAATTSVPVVMTAALDPVGNGLVRSFVRPGGNLTGMSLQAVEATAKRFELLKELVPGGAPVGVIWNRASLQSLEAAQGAARDRGWAVLPIEITDAEDWKAAFHAAAKARVSALLVLAAQVLFPRARSVAELAAGLRLPAVYELRSYVDAGGLMCYGPDIVDIWRRAAGFVVKILDGAKPAEIPIEQPTRFELVINQRTARALGLEVPQRLMLRADEVIS